MPINLTRATLVTEVCDFLQRSKTALAVSQTELQTRVSSIYLNVGQRHIANVATFPEMMTSNSSAATVISVKSYPLETGTNNLGLSRVKDIATVKLVDSANSRKLRRWTYRKFDKKVPDPTQYANGRPSLYVRWGNNLELFKIPDAVYTLDIRYLQFPADFTSDSQTSDLDGRDDLIILATALKTYQAVHEKTSYNEQLVLAWKQELADSIHVQKAVLEDMDWEPEAEAFNNNNDSNTASGEYWLDPFCGIKGGYLNID